MALVALGLTNDEIAEQLVISRATAKTHVSRAMVKLHARDRAQVVVFAYESGLVLPRSDAESRTLAIAWPSPGDRKLNASRSCAQWNSGT